MKPTRVLLLGMPTMLRQILQEITADAQDLLVVAELIDAELDSPEVMAADADVVITGAEQASEATVRGLLCRPRPLRVLGISADGRDAIMYEMRPHKVFLGELAPATLVSVLRGTTSAGA